jgi:hypothetical protein
MASDAAYVAFAHDALARSTAEIGAHVHAWNLPPLQPLTHNDFSAAPYLIEYPRYIQRQKLDYLTGLLEDTFQIKMRSHRAGRWAFDAFYASNLLELGYQIDCSVTPGVDWRASKGDPSGSGGTDYRLFPRYHYRLAEDDIAKPGSSALLEVPVTIMDTAPEPIRRVIGSGSSRSLWRRALRRLWPLRWLRPNGRNLASMCAILDQAREEHWPYVEFMMHSSELMPGGSPGFQTPKSVEKLYADLDILFEMAEQGFKGMTLSEFFNQAMVTAATATAGCHPSLHHV